MKITIILGTRPEIIKIAPVISELGWRENYCILHTGQHDSYNLDSVFIEQLKLPQAKFNLEVSLQTMGYFMIGSPGESPETIRQTIQFAKRLKLDFAQFAVATPFPGTKLFNLYLDGRRGDNIPWESFVYAGSGGDIAPVFESSLLNRDDIQYWTRRAYREFYLRPSYPWQRIRHTTSIGDLKVGIKGLSMLLGNIRPISKGRG